MGFDVLNAHTNPFTCLPMDQPHAFLPCMIPAMMMMICPSATVSQPPIKYFLSEELPRLWWLFIAIEQWLRLPLLFFHWLSTVVEGSLRKPRSSWKSSITLLFLLFIRPQFTRGLSQMPTILTTSLSCPANLIYELPTLNVWVSPYLLWFLWGLNGFICAHWCSSDTS